MFGVADMSARYGLFFNVRWTGAEKSAYSLKSSRLGNSYSLAVLAFVGGLFE
jgi:hypothetical protein